MTYEIRLHDQFNDDFEAIPLLMQTRIMHIIDSLADNPRPMGVKKLSGIKHGMYRVRVGNYRIVYQIFDRELIVLVLTTGKRGDVYQVLKRRIR